MPIITETGITRIITANNRNQAIRLTTAAALVGLCGCAIFFGWNILAFTAARAEISSHEGRLASLRRWIGMPGLAAAAIDLLLRQTASAKHSEPPRKRAHELAALLSVRPLSSAGWLSLAGMRFAEGAPYKSVLGALTMSWLTGPNEGGVMWERGTFGLLQWGFLPSPARARAIRDLAGALDAGIVDDGEAKSTKAIIAMLPSESRAKIAASLHADGVADAALGRLGL